MPHLHPVITTHRMIALDLDTDEHFALTPKPVIRAIPMLLGSKQVQSAINPDILTAQEAPI